VRQSRRNAPQQIPIFVPYLPSIHIIFPAVERLGIRTAIKSIGDLAMVPAQPLHNALEERDGSAFGRDDFTDDDGSGDDIVSLLEENARLRKLVVRLSEIVLRNVADG
jgi:hypothetical protein